MIANDDIQLNKFKHYLESWFPIKDLGILKYFLGIEVAHSHEGIVLSRGKYTLDILQEASLLGVKPCHFPIEQNHKLVLDDSPLLHDPSFYRRLVGRSIYLTITWSDICYSVHVLS